jgi:signal transduction histidine kinase/ligand-binding sensor domain-containing protein
VIGQEHNKRQSVYVDTYGLEEGLRQSMISCVYQDSTGLIWAASGDGLHCFDGKKFKAFRIPFKGSYHHSDNMMRMINGNASGDFIISSSSSLFRFNPESADFNFISREMSVYVVLLDAQINGCSLAWTLNKGLSIVKNDSLISLNISYNDGLKPSAGFIPIKTAWYNTNTLMIMGKEGIIHLSTQDKKEKESSSSNRIYHANWESAPDCKGMATDSQGNIYIIRGTTLYKYNGKTTWIPLTEKPITAGLVFFIDHHQNFWFTGNSNHKLFRLNSRVIDTIDLVENSGKNTDTIATDIKYIFEDKSHNLWFGTDGYGLLKYNPHKVMFNKKLIGFTRCLTSIGSYIYAGTYNKGLWKLTEDLSTGIRLNPQIFDNNEYIINLTTDKSGRIWVVSRIGLYVVTTEGKVVYNLPGSCITANFICSDNETIELIKDSELLTFSAKGAPRLISKKKHYEIRSLITKHNKEWVATPSGLYLIPSHLSGVRMNAPPGKLLSNSEIFNLAELNNEVWAATGNGVEIFASDGNKVTAYKGVAELMNEAIYSLLPDKEGRIWFTGIRGMGYICTLKDRIIRFWPENNLQSLEFNQNATCVTESGMFCFGGINGINSINPSYIDKSSKIPQVRLFSLKVSDSIYSPGIIPYNTRVELDRRFPNIEGSVFTTNYGEPRHSGFSFLLQGYESDWNESTPDATFSYRNLQPGSYRLYVKYTDILKNEGTPQLLLTINIKHAYWQTIWFYLGIILFIIVSTILIVRKVQSIRYGNKIKELEREKAIEKERTRISKDMHDEVGASLTRISILTELAKKQQSQSQKSNEIIDKISIIAGDVVDELSEIIWAMNPKNDNLETFAAYIRRYAGTYLESTGLFIKFDFPLNIPSLPMTAEIRRNLFLILKEALHNVVKHAEASNVLLKLLIRDGNLTITIRDDGKGIVLNTTLSKGNGLHNMQFRAMELGGNYNIITGEGSGTEISITVSLSCANKSH